MSEKIKESSLPTLIKKIGTMTAIRDTFLVEQSLLRTLGPLLGVLKTSFYRIDDRGGIQRALHHSRKVVINNGAQHIVENIEEIDKANVFTDIELSLFESVRLLAKPCSKKLGHDFLMCYPVFGKKELCGFFIFQRDHESSQLEDAVIQGILEVFTNYYELLDTSQRDQLTGLLNRYSLESNLDRLWNLLSARIHDAEGNSVSANRTTVAESYWLGILDIDNFKNINDTFGHTIGDEVLILTTRLLQSAFRQSDLIYRYGGEEFMVIIASNNLETATMAFERARTKIEQFKFPQVGQVTISCGFSGADPRVLPQEVINRADSSLYAAKNAGRNRVYNYDMLIKEGVLKDVPSGSVDLF